MTTTKGPERLKAEWDAHAKDYNAKAAREAGLTRKWTFTFGSDHRHPDTGESLGRCYVQIEATDREAARDEMVRLFGTKWAFQYDSPEKAGAAKYGLREVDLPK